MKRKIAKSISLLFGFILIVSCGSSDDDMNGNGIKPEPTVFEMNYSYSDVGTNTDYIKTHDNLLSPEVNQLENTSGLAIGRKNTDFVYIIEGRDNENAIHVFNKDAEFQGKIILEGADNIDWQDIAIGPGPDQNTHYILIGDIGDRQSNRENLTVYRLPEPNVSGQSIPFEVTVSNFETIKFSVSEKRDFQTLMVDPFSGDIIVIGTMQAMVYRLKYPQSTTSVTRADFKGHHRLRREIKAGDISPDGKYILLKDVGEVFKWEVPSDEDPIKVMFETAPERVTYTSEIEGGALGWNAESNGYFTLTDTDKRDGIRRGQPILYGYTR